MDTLTLLDCGHAPTVTDGIGTGYARDAEGKRYCYECADNNQREAMARETDIYAYVSGDGKRITTWTGGHLANVTGSRMETRYTPTGGYYRRYYYWARENGRDWYGIGEGPGMHVRIRRVKP